MLNMIVIYNGFPTNIAYILHRDFIYTKLKYVLSENLMKSVDILMVYYVDVTYKILRY